MRNIKIFILIICGLIPSVFYGQLDEIGKEGEGFNSIFQNLKTGNFQGTLNGVFEIREKNENLILLDFQGSPANLRIEEDKDEVYDISSKIYEGTTTSGKSAFIYKTYAAANALKIQFKGEWYELSLIDGACDMVINGLEYEYKTESSAEYLILRVVRPINLNNAYNSKERKTICLMPNSVLIIVIKRR
jgi:hypothetical protein